MPFQLGDVSFLVQPRLGSNTQADLEKSMGT